MAGTDRFVIEIAAQRSRNFGEDFAVDLVNGKYREVFVALAEFSSGLDWEMVGAKHGKNLLEEKSACSSLNRQPLPA